ncbi:MAG TPA: hypothetical protein VF980_20860 [Thermoanaerobaculia bacterium]
MTDARMNWKKELRPTTECPSIERLAGELNAQEREHVAHCARCEAEVALWNEFRDGAITIEEAPVVRWVSDEIRRRVEPARTVPTNVVPLASRRPVFRPRMLAAAAMLIIAITIGYVVQNHEPSVNVPFNTNVYRSSSIAVTTPVGDVAAAPKELQWKEVAGATSYGVTVSEVDGTVLWQGETRDSRIQLPSSVSSQFVPAKTILWEVTARRGASVLAQSGQQKFRVAPGQP